MLLKGREEEWTARGEIAGIAGLEIVKRNAKEALIGFFHGKSLRTI
jgi:hypothetical protein